MHTRGIAWIGALLVAVVAESAGLGRRTLLTPFVAPSKQVSVAFFDADSTLRITKSGEVAPNDPDDVAVLPMTGAKLGELARRGYFIAIVSNQAGIGRHLTLQDADDCLRRTVKLLRAQGAVVHYYDFAEHYGKMRKPRTGMAELLETKLEEFLGEGISIDWERSFMVGDSAYLRARGATPAEIRPDGRPGFDFSNSDRGFAENLGIPFHEPQDFFGWKAHGIDRFRSYEEVLAFGVPERCTNALTTRRSRRPGRQ